MRRSRFLGLAILVTLIASCGDETADAPSPKSMDAPPARHGGTVLPVDGVATYVEVTREPTPVDMRLYLFRGSEPLEITIPPLLSRMREQRKRTHEFQQGPAHVWTSTAVAAPGTIGTAALRFDIGGDLHVVPVPPDL